MNKKLNIILYTICCILALYGLIILIRNLGLLESFQLQPFIELNTNNSSQIQPSIQPLSIPEQIVQKPQQNLCINNCNDKCRIPFRGGFKVNSACMDDCINYC